MLTLVKGDYDSRVFQLPSGEKVKLTINESGVKIYEMKSGVKIGELSFRMWEEGSGSWTEQVYKLTHAFLEGKNGSYQGKGIATAAFEFFYETYGDSRFEFPEYDGLKHDDGSHMTSDGFAFVESLKRKFP